MSISTDVTIHTATINRTKNLGWFTANSDIGLISVTHEELRTVQIAWRIRDVRCWLTTTATKHVSVWQTGRRIIRIHTIRRSSCINIADSTTGYIHSTLTTAQEGLAKLIAIIPEVWACWEFLTIACGWVVIRSPGIITLSDRPHVTTAIYITNHITAFHVYFGVTKHLTSCDAVARCFIGGLCLCRWCCCRSRSMICYIAYIRRLCKRFRKLSLTTTASIDRVIYQTFLQSQLSVTHDVTIFTTTIDSTSDAVTIARIGRWSWRIVNCYISRTDVSTEDKVFIVARLTLACTIYITIVGPNISLLGITFSIFDTDTSTRNINMCCTVITLYILKLIRPA